MSNSSNSARTGDVMAAPSQRASPRSEARGDVRTEKPAPYPHGMPRRKPTSSSSYDRVRLSKAPTSPVHISYSSQDFPPRSSSVQVFDPALTASPISYSPSVDMDAEYPASDQRSYSPVLHYYSDTNRSDSPQQPPSGFSADAETRDSDSPGYEPFSSERFDSSRQSSIGSIDQSLRDVRLGPTKPYQHSPLPGDTSRRGGPEDRDFGEGIPSARSESPASSLVGDNNTMPPRRLLAPVGHANARHSASQPSLQVRDRGRAHSPMGSLGAHAHARPASMHSAHSPDSRPTSYADLLNVPYPQPAPAGAASFDHTHLRNAIGSNASLLSHKQTLEMYRANVKKTNDPATLYEFAIFMANAARDAGATGSEDENSAPRKRLTSKAHRDLESPYVDNTDPATSTADLIRESRQILQRLADRSYPFAQYYLADGYASGLFNKGKEDYDKAFPLFVAAGKHGHAESAYRAALCYEFGWGCRKDPSKAVQYYRHSASKNHPGAMIRLGKACLRGDLGMGKRPREDREGVKWLKRAAESADRQYNAAPYELALLHEKGYGEDVFQDEGYAAELFTKAAELGHADANYRLGDAYEHGRLNCPRDPALSVHFYNEAAQKDHPLAMMALCAWYMVGAEPVLEKDENEAYEWAMRAARLGKPPSAFPSDADRSES